MDMCPSPRTITLCAAALAVALATPPCFGDDLPKRKSGLWEIKTASLGTGKATSGAEGASVQMCIDEKTDNAVQQQAIGMAKQSCSRQDIRRTGSQVVVDSVCKFGDTTATTHSVFTGSFESAYKVETHSTYQPPMMGMSEGSAVIEAKFLGPCKPDQRPGDMILGNGMKINMNDKKGK